jgi:hypothetical protein
MQKTILFPTDFTVGSLNIVRAVLEKMPEGRTCRIILLHGYRPGSSITDLLFSSGKQWSDSLTNKEFDTALEVIRNKFESRLTSMATDLFIGHNQNAFNNYLEANRVDEIYMPQEHLLSLTNKRSFDLAPFIRKSGMVVNEVRVRQTSRMPEKGMVAEVFQDNMVLN